MELDVIYTQIDGPQLFESEERSINLKIKTMKSTTLKKRLEKRYQGPKNTVAYKIVTDVINGTDEECRCYQGKIRPCYTSGSGRFTSNQDHTDKVRYLLNLIGIKHVTGNDAPRGGITGNYIVIKTKIKIS